jgi:hypothetical protein
MYNLAPDTIKGDLELEGHFKQKILLQNKLDTDTKLKFDIEGNVSDISALDTFSTTLYANDQYELVFNAFGEEPITTGNETIDYPLIYTGKLVISEGINEELPIKVTINDKSDSEAGSLIMEVKPLKYKVIIGKNLRYIVDLKNVYSDRTFNLTLNHSLIMLNDRNGTGKISFGAREVNKTIPLLFENLSLTRTFSVSKDFPINKSTYIPGEYILLIRAKYLGFESLSVAAIDIDLPWLQKKVFGFLPNWLLLIILGLALVGFITYKIVKAQMEKRKRFHVKVCFFVGFCYLSYENRPRSFFWQFFKVNFGMETFSFFHLPPDDKENN